MRGTGAGQHYFPGQLPGPAGPPGDPTGWVDITIPSIDIKTPSMLSIENFFREKLKLRSTPLFIDFRESDNPFKGKPNLLTSKQKKKRTRMIKRSKK